DQHVIAHDLGVQSHPRPGRQPGLGSRSAADGWSRTVSSGMPGRRLIGTYRHRINPGAAETTGFRVVSSGKADDASADTPKRPDFIAVTAAWPRSAYRGGANRRPIDRAGLMDAHRPGPIVTAAWAVA